MPDTQHRFDQLIRDHRGSDSALPSDRRAFLGLGATAVAGQAAAQLEYVVSALTGRTPAAAALGDHMEQLQAEWHALVRADNLAGPRSTLPAVLERLNLLDRLLESVPYTHRPAVASMAAQYAESASWLCEDSGQLREAVTWSWRALEWAHEARDDVMIAWTLFRRSQQAKNGGQILNLTQAASRATDPPAPMRAAINQQQALAHAMLGDETLAERHIELALDWASSDDHEADARTGHGSFATPSYVQAQRGRCLITLGQPIAAVTALEEASQTMPLTYARDRGITLAYLAQAYALTNHIEEATTFAQLALETAKECGSTRTTTHVGLVAAQLAPHADRAAVRDLQNALAS